MKKTDTLVYTGGATAREITRAEWVAAGVEGQETIRWTENNGKSVVIGDLSKAALEVLLEEHGGEFRVTSTTEAENTSADTGKETAR